MHAGAERHVWVGIAPDVEIVGSIEHRRIPVRGPEQQAELGSLGNRCAADLRVLQHPPLEHLQRGVPPHQLWIARGTKVALLRRRASWSGLRNNDHQPFPVTFTVASRPAFRSRTQVPISSSSVSRSPSSRTSASPLIRSSRGSARRSLERVRR